MFYLIVTAVADATEADAAEAKKGRGHGRQSGGRHRGGYGLAARPRTSFLLPYVLLRVDLIHTPLRV